MFPGWNPMQQAYFQPQFQMVPMQQMPYNWMNPGMAPAPQPPMPDAAPAAGVPPTTKENPPPPGEDLPPLPPDPPPAPAEDEKPKEDELKPKDPVEEQKLEMLKNQAAVWQQSQQMQQQGAMWGAWPPPGVPPMPFQPVPYNPMDAILKEEQEFNVQYDQWKQQYNDWREQNKSHPNKEQFQQYLQQWQMYEKQMEEKKADIARRKEMAEQQMKQMQQAPQPPQVPMYPGQQGFTPMAPGFDVPRQNMPLQFDGPRPDAPRLEGPRPDGPRFESPRPDGPRFDGPRPEAPRFDGPRPEAPRFDGPRPEAPRFDGPRPDVPRFDGPRPDAPRFDGPRPEAPRFDGPRPEVPRFDGPRSEAPRFDGPRPEAPRFDGPRPDAPRFDGPRFEGQRFNGPPPQGARFDGPRFEGPRGPGSENFRPQFGSGRGVGNIGPNFGQEFQASDQNSQQDPNADDHNQEDMVLDVLDSTDDNFVDNILLSENLGVNKMMLNQLSDESKDLINQIGQEGKIVLSAFAKMNPAQLNKMVRVINDFGDEIKVSKRTGRPVRPDLKEKMKADLMSEMRAFGLNVPAELGNDKGMGRGQRFDNPPPGSRPPLLGRRPLLEDPRGPKPLLEGFQGQNFGPRGQRFGGPRFSGPTHREFSSSDRDFERTNFKENEEQTENIDEDEVREEEKQGMNQNFGMGSGGFNPVPRQPEMPQFNAGQRFGMDSVRGPRPGMDNTRGPRPGIDNTGGPRPRFDNMGMQRPGMDNSRFPRPGIDNMRGPRPGMDNIRGPRPGRDDVRGQRPGGGGPVPLMSLFFDEPRSQKGGSQAPQFGPKGGPGEGPRIPGGPGLLGAEPSTPGGFQGEVPESPKEKKPPTPVSSTPVHSGSTATNQSPVSQTKLHTTTSTTASTFDSKTSDKNKTDINKTVNKDQIGLVEKDIVTDSDLREAQALVSSAAEIEKIAGSASMSSVSQISSGSKFSDQLQGQYASSLNQNSSISQQNDRNFQQQNRNFQEQNNAGQDNRNFRQQNNNRNFQQQNIDRNFQQQNERNFQQQNNQRNFQQQNSQRNFQQERFNNERQFQQNVPEDQGQYDESSEQEQQEGYEQYGEGYNEGGYNEGEYTEEGYNEEGYNEEGFGQFQESEDYQYGQEQQQYERDRQQRDQWGQGRAEGPERDRDRSIDRGAPWGNREEQFERRRPPFGEREEYRGDQEFWDGGRRDRQFGERNFGRGPPPPQGTERRPFAERQDEAEDPYAASQDPYDRYPDPYREPPFDRRDPYFRDRLYDDRGREGREPYRRPPWDDPYRRDFDDRRMGFDEPYRSGPPGAPERAGFKPAETIDYGHKPSMSGGGRDEGSRPFQPPAVIDYGHGQTKDDHPGLHGRSDRLGDLPTGFNPRPVDLQEPSGRFNPRPMDMRDDRRGGNWDRPAPPPIDRGFPSPFMEREGFGHPPRRPPGPPPGPPPSHPPPGHPPPGHPPPEKKKTEKVKVEDILVQPGRAARPQQIVVIVRGLPGSGKTYVSKLIKGCLANTDFYMDPYYSAIKGLGCIKNLDMDNMKQDKEVSNGGSAPRMLCLDDYFMIEVDRIEKDPETGKRMKKKVLEYEYEAEMESAYRQNMLKSFKKTIDDGFFPFIIVDAVFDRVKHFEEFWSYAKSKGFQVYVAEMHAEVNVCAKRNTHKRTQREIEKLKNKWDDTPSHYIRLDVRSLLQEDSITEVEMEDLDKEPAPAADKEQKEEEEDDDDYGGPFIKKSKWELDISEGTLDKLDGLQHGKVKHATQSMDEYLQLADEYFAKQIQDPGKKRVRWADLEERKEQSYRRELGFVVGQTQRDWERITDDSYAERQLNRTKYF